MKFGIDRLLAEPELRRPLEGKRVALGLGEQAVDAEFHAAPGAGSAAAKQAGAWKSGFPSGCASAQ